jgi:hypothetical protein
MREESAELEGQLVSEFAPACRTEFGKDRLKVVMHGTRGDVQADADPPAAKRGEHAGDRLAGGGIEFA